MAAIVENKLGSYEKRKEQIRRYELFLETNGSTDDTSTKPVVKKESKKSKHKISFAEGCVFLAACSSGSTEDVRELLKNSNADIINTTNVDGLTGLHQACINEDIKMVKFLVDNGINVNTRDNEGWTALHAAAQSGFTDIAKYLIDHGAKLDLINCDCEIPLDLSQSPEMTQLLQESMDSKGIDGHTARSAEKRMMMEDVKKWMEAGRYDGVADEKTGASPLHVAAVKGYLDVVKSLIQLKAPVDAVDFEGWTPLHGAAHWGQAEACRLLAESYCDLNAVNEQGCTPLDIADPSVEKLLEELLEKRKLMPENISVVRPYSIKGRKSSITRLSHGQMKGMQKKNEEDEKAPASTFDNIEDEDAVSGVVSGNVERKEICEEVEEERSEETEPIVTKFESKVKKEVEETTNEETNPAEKLEKKTIITGEELMSPECVQSLLDERRKKLNQYRASDSRVEGVIMRRDLPKEKQLADPRAMRMIASDLVRRSVEPASWRFGYRRSSNSDNDPEVDQLFKISDSKRPNTMAETGETDEDKEQKKKNEKKSFDISSFSTESKTLHDDTPHDGTQHDSTPHDLTPHDGTPPSPHSAGSSLLRPETAAALASIASSHQRLSDVIKRDDANELERKLKAKRARESRRSTQGVTKEDIQRAEDTLKAAYQDGARVPISQMSSDVTDAVTGTDGGSGDVRKQSSATSLLSTATSSSAADVQSSTDTTSVASIIEKWQRKEEDGVDKKEDIMVKKEGETVGRGDSRNLAGLPGSTVGGISSPSQKNEYSTETLRLYRKLKDLSNDYPKDATSTVQPSDTNVEQFKDKDADVPEEDSSTRIAANRSRRKRENRRPTGKITLENNEEADPDEVDDEEQTNTTSLTTSSLTSKSSVIYQQPDSTATTSSILHGGGLPKAIPSTTSLSSLSVTNISSRYSTSHIDPQQSTSSLTRKFAPSGGSSNERWSTLASSSWQPTSRSSNIFPSSYDPMSSNLSRVAGSVSSSSSATSKMTDTDYQKLWEKEKSENESLLKKVTQLERDLRNSQLQLAASTSSKTYDRIDAREKRACERKISELEEEKKVLEEKVSNLEGELKKLDSVKTDNTKLRSENAALIRVISKLSK